MTKQQQKKPRTAITPTREGNFPEWYQQVIKAADLAENSPVRGCMIIKPYGFALWENIQRTLDDMIKDAGVQNAYFPLLIPLEFISREAKHIDGFATECAVVTHHRLEKTESGALEPAPSAKLDEPYIIRPTSETIIGDSMGRWVQSYRDLPMKVNQWCNVMRWEMRPRMFLRNVEFLWQEGHNAFVTEKEAREDMEKMLHIYKTVYEDYMAVPGIMGAKTADERFPGAEDTLTYESMMQDGKALQSCTSHYMGQTFSKSFGIDYQTKDGDVDYAYTTSWGLSTRSMGGLIMTHSDDDGLIAPPKIAPHHIAIIPIIRDDGDTAKIMEACTSLRERLKEQNVRAVVDETDRRTPDKMWDAVKKGVPLRVEIGAREVEDKTLTHVRRDIGRDSKTSETVDQFCNSVSSILDDIQNSLFKKAERFMQENTHEMQSADDVKSFYKSKNIGFVKLDTSMLEETSLQHAMSDHSLSARCLPLEDDGQKVIIGKAY